MTPDLIYLTWPEVKGASDYKVYWDKGTQGKQGVLYLLATTTYGQPYFNVNYESSNKVIGSDYIVANGGRFKFWVTYVTSTGQESAMSNLLEVTVKKKTEILKELNNP